MFLAKGCYDSDLIVLSDCFFQSLGGCWFGEESQAAQRILRAGQAIFSGFFLIGSNATSWK